MFGPALNVAGPASLMNLASLFNLEAPDFFVILVIVLLLFGIKRRSEFFRGFAEDRTPKAPNLFNVFASLLLFVALTVLLLALASR